MTSPSSSSPRALASAAHCAAVAVLALLVVVAGAGCAGAQRPPSHEQMASLRRVAIVSRVDSVAPRLDLGSGERPAANEAPESLAARLAQQMRRFEAEERLRVAVVERLPARAPWSTAMPAVEVATLLQTLLVEESGPRAQDYRVLARHGCDAVLELHVTGLGVRSRAGTRTLFLDGEARLFTLRGATLWRGPLDIGLDATEARGPVDLEDLARGGYREALVELLGAAAARVTGALGEAPTRAEAR